MRPRPSSASRTCAPARRARRIPVAPVLAALVALATAGRASAGSVDLPVQVGGGYTVAVASVKELRFRATVRQRYDFSCGSAALATLLTHHYGAPVGEDAVFEEMYARGDAAKIRQAGFSLLDLKLYLAAHGYDADGFEAPLERLAEAGVPAIVLVKENGYTHFVVVKGLRGPRVLIGDPAGGTRVVSTARFEASRVNDILFVVNDHAAAARFNTPADWSVAPVAPLGDGIDPAVAASMLDKRGPSDF